MNVVLYLRYSSSSQSYQSIEGQRTECEKFCKANGHHIIREYVDEAVSASHDISNRENFLRMIHDSAKKDFEAVIVYKLDRFARSVYDNAVYEQKLNENNVKLVSATETISDNPEGIILKSLLVGMNEYYSAELRQKVVRGMQESAKKHNSTGGQVPLGYKIVDKKYVIDEETAPIVRYIFEKYAEGVKKIDIVRTLNANGYVSSSGATFGKNSLQYILRNPKYYGVYKYGSIYEEGEFPAIISKELFDKVQAKIHDNLHYRPSAHPKANYLLSGKLFCGHCKSRMTGESVVKPNGTKYFYYTCSKEKKSPSSCKMKRVNKDVIENFVISEAMKLLTDERIEEIANEIERIYLNDQEQDSMILSIQKRIDELTQKKENIVNAIADMGYEKSLGEKINAINKELDDAKIELDNCTMSTVHITKDQIIFFFLMLKQKAYEDETFYKILINVFIDKIYIYDDTDNFRIETHYRITDKPIGSSTVNSNAPPTESESNLSFDYENMTFRITTKLPY